MTDRLRVAVLHGGWSSEREVSFSSGQAVIDALKRQKYDVIAIDPVGDLVRFAAQISTARPDVIFNALHGTGGEDGIIAGALEMTDIPYTHSGHAASAVAMDKKLTKIIAASLGIKIAEDIIIRRGDLAKGHPIQPPYVVKPVNEGSSVGVTIVQNDATQAMQGDSAQMVLVEKYIAGDELTVGVLDVGGKAEVLGITKLEPKSGFYDHEAKYTVGMTAHIVNPDLPADITKAMVDAALKIHQTLGCRDASRSDFRYNPADGAVFLEINTHPGMTGLSLLPEQALAKGIVFDTLVVTIINAAIARRKVKPA